MAAKKKTKAKKKPKKSRSPFTNWYTFDTLFKPNDGGLVPHIVEGTPIAIPGPLGDRLVVVVPTTATAGQVERIAGLVEEATGQVPLVLTNNVVMAKMRKLTPDEAKKAIGG